MRDTIFLSILAIITVLGIFYAIYIGIKNKKVATTDDMSNCPLKKIIFQNKRL
jgi:hypothetical protein